MVPFFSLNLLAGIWLTQVGDPLPHRQNGVRDSASSDRLVLLTFSSVAESKDQDVGELGLLPLHVREVRMDGDGLAEGSPESEDLVTASVGLGSVGFVRDCQSIAEVSCEAVSGCRWSSFQGRGCG